MEDEPLMPDVVRALSDRLIDRRASMFSRMILRAAIRAAVDIVWSGGNATDDATEAEGLLREALTCFRALATDEETTELLHEAWSVLVHAIDMGDVVSLTRIDGAPASQELDRALLASVRLARGLDDKEPT